MKENQKVWVITKHSINSNEISRPEIAYFIEYSKNWAYPHVKVKLANGKYVTIPEERCFETLRKAVDYVEEVYEQQKIAFANMQKRYDASKKKLEDLNIMLNYLLSNEEYEKI